MTPDSLDDAALLALGVLPEAEARALRDRLTADADARAEYLHLRGVADAIGYAAESGDVPSAEASARMRAALLAKIAPATPVNGTATIASLAAAREAANGRRGLGSRANAWLGLSTAAAIAFAVFAGIDDARQRDAATRAAAVVDAAAARVSAAQEQTLELSRTLAVVADANARRYAIPVGSIVASRGGIVLAMAKLPALPQGKVYQAWTLARGAKAMSPSVTFRPDGGGAALVALPLADPSTVAAVAVSVEPEGGSRAPTSTPTFVRPLS